MRMRKRKNDGYGGKWWSFRERKNQKSKRKKLGFRECRRKGKEEMSFFNKKIITFP